MPVLDGAASLKIKGKPSPLFKGPRPLIGELRICAEAGAVEIAWALTQQLPGKDAPILAAAVQANSMLLVTGDHRDFGHLFGKTLRGTQVLPPVATLERIIGR